MNIASFWQAPDCVTEVAKVKGAEALGGLLRSIWPGIPKITCLVCRTGSHLITGSDLQRAME